MGNPVANASPGYGDDGILDSSSPGERINAPGARALRLFVVSGVRLVREGLVRSIGRRKDVIVAGLSDFSASQVAVIRDVRPDVIVVDLANHEGLTTAEMLRSLAPGAKLVAFSVTEVEEEVYACAAAGFSSYVTREARVNDLLQAVRDAYVGRLTCTPHMAAAMFNQISQMLKQREPAGASSEMTARERQILNLLNDGRSNKEIARELKISPSTVKNHIHNVLQKLNVERRAQAVAVMRS